MSAFSRFVHIPAARRSYSYFSSRSGGGGRYFNSTKPPKPPVVAQGTASAANASSNGITDSSSESKNNDGVQTTAPPTNAGSLPSQTANSSLEAATGTGTDAFGSPFVAPAQLMSAKDFKMHHFFSLHRPLLLINQPTSLFRSVPDNHPLFNPLPLSEAEIERKIMQSQSGMAGPPHTTNYPSSTGPTSSDTAAYIDADAEAARQLTRALTMSKAGSTVSWETTLHALGLDLNKEADRVGLQQQFEKEWQDVMLDSTKRKRRKKMKKHKLKKRRRATRSERLRLK
ncbi:hypothetical protein CPB83DRAFT_867528 [Crepidotus variabilis]|uniref:Small ribosomal subunit protein mS38 n=1 Tax=Crepidotus variabilis TaxID=179855 RepID=A0A9P6ELU9_9AGAR|nr:hypothetical protein CPB83DRAFT_867528 [Crepidotus variabilis]